MTFDFRFFSFAHLLPSACPRPTIFRRFYDPQAAHESKSSTNVPDDWAISAAILDATCDLSIMYNEVMEYNRRESTINRFSSEADVSQRVGYLKDLREWRKALPFDIRAERRFSPATVFVG